MTTENINQQMQQLEQDRDAMVAGRAGWDRYEYGDGQVTENSVFASKVTGERWIAWHSVGHYLEHESSMSYERLVGIVPAFGSDYVKVPVTADYQGEVIEVPNANAVVRAYDQRVLGVVSDSYPLIPPREAYDFLQDLLIHDDVRIISAVDLRQGAQIALTVEIPGHIEVQGWTDETIRKLIVLTNSVDAKGALTVACSPVRGECINSTRLINTTSPRVWTGRHTKNLRDRMTLARETLRLASAYFTEVESVANVMVSTKMSRRQFDGFMKRLLPYTPKMEADPGGRAAKNRERAVEAVTNAFVNSPNLGNITGTRWGALQAVLEWNQWERPVRGTKRDDRVIATVEENRWNRALSGSQAIETRAMKLLAV